MRAASASLLTRRTRGDRQNERESAFYQKVTALARVGPEPSEERRQRHGGTGGASRRTPHRTCAPRQRARPRTREASTRSGDPRRTLDRDTADTTTRSHDHTRGGARRPGAGPGWSERDAPDSPPPSHHICKTRATQDDTIYGTQALWTTRRPLDSSQRRATERASTCMHRIHQSAKQCDGTTPRDCWQRPRGYARTRTDTRTPTSCVLKSHGTKSQPAAAE